MAESEPLACYCKDECKPIDGDGPTELWFCCDNGWKEEVLARAGEMAIEKIAKKM